MTAEPRSDPAPARINLTGADLHQITAVKDHLERHRVYSEWHDDVLSVPARHEYEVRQVVLDAAPRMWHGFELDDTLRAWRRAGARIARPIPADAGLGVAVFEPAPIWMRLLASIVDVIALAFVALLAAGLAATAMNEQPTTLQILVGLLVSAIAIVPVALWGWTIGKLVVGIRVFVSSGLVPPGWARSLARWWVPGVPGLVASLVVGLDPATVVKQVVAAAALIAWLTIYGSIVTDPDRRGLHDRIVGTLVVRPTAAAVTSREA